MDATVLSVHVALHSGDDLESVKELVLHPMDATVSVIAVVIQLVLHPMDATVASVAVDFSIILDPLHSDATVLSVHVACSGDDL